jgi:hypothetical protein
MPCQVSDMAVAEDTSVEEKCEVLKEIDGNYYEMMYDLIRSDPRTQKISKIRIVGKQIVLHRMLAWKGYLSTRVHYLTRLQIGP